MRKLVAAFVGGAAIAALTTSLLWSQVTLLTPSTLTGNETWQVAIGGPGGMGVFATSYMMRNSTGTALSNGAAPQTLPVTTSLLVLTAQPASGANITLPAAPFDGQIFEVTNGTTGAFATNVFSIVPNTGQTIVGGNIALTTLANGASRELRYALSTNTWYPIR